MTGRERGDAYNSSRKTISVQSPEAQSLTRVVSADVRVNVLCELGGLVAVRALVFGRHAAFVAEMPRHVLLQGEAAIAARAVMALVQGVNVTPPPHAWART